MGDEAIINRLLRDLPPGAKYFAAADIRARGEDKIEVWVGDSLAGTWTIAEFKELVRRKTTGEM